MTEGDLCTAIVVACRNAGHPITVPAARHAAAEALHHLDPPPPRQTWPTLMVELHESMRYTDWGQPGRLAAALRAHADRLEARATDAMIADAIAAA